MKLRIHNRSWTPAGRLLSSWGRRPPSATRIEVEHCEQNAVETYVMAAAVYCLSIVLLWRLLPPLPWWCALLLLPPLHLLVLHVIVAGFSGIYQIADHMGKRLPVTRMVFQNAGLIVLLSFGALLALPGGGCAAWISLVWLLLVGLNLVFALVERMLR